MTKGSKELKPIFATMSYSDFYPDGEDSQFIEITCTAPNDTEVFAGDVVIVPIELWNTRASNSHDKLVEALMEYHNSFKNVILTPRDGLFLIKKKVERILSGGGDEGK